VELSKAGKSIHKHLSPNIEMLAADAKKVIELQKFMPDNVIRNYKGNLLDDKRANDFIYELHVAWHHLLKGSEVQWNELDGPQHEFTVKNGAFSFNVECKRISVDSFRKIKRGDFYNLVDLLLPDIQDRNLTGKVELAINDRLKGTDSFIDGLKAFILDTIDRGFTCGNYENDVCKINLNLLPGSNREVDMHQEYRDMWQSKMHQDHGAIIAKSHNNAPADPIHFLCRSEKLDHILKGIGTKLKDASNRQLNDSMPGIISVFVEDIDDFSDVASESGLQMMTSEFLASEKRKHIAAVIYSSDSKCLPDAMTKTYFSQGLIYRNNNCKFKDALGYKYLS